VITPSFEAEGIRQAVKHLREVDPQLVKDLRKDLRTKVSPFAKQVAEAFPPEPIISGMRSNTRLGWSAARASVSVTPGRSRKTGNHLVSIRVNPVGGRVGILLAEAAGRASSGQVPRGRNMIKGLNSRQQMKGKAGRFAYTKFRLLRPDAMKLAFGIVERTVGDINRRSGF